MSFLTQRYIVTGQLPENAPEEQLEAIRKLEREYNSAGLKILSGLGNRTFALCPFAQNRSYVRATVIDLDREPMSLVALYKRVCNCERITLNIS